MSASVSTRETKNDATDARVDGSPPSSTKRSSPRMYDSATCRWRSSEKMSVTWMGMPAAIDSSIAFSPGSVAGILMKTFGRSTILLRRRASSIVFSVSKAMFGSTSSDTQPSRPSSHRGRRMSQAFLTSVTASSKKTALSSSSRSMTSRICSSYESPEANAFWKIDGLLVTPTTASSRTRRSSSPLSIISRESESIQTLWPRSDSSCSRDLLMV